MSILEHLTHRLSTLNEVELSDDMFDDKEEAVSDEEEVETDTEEVVSDEESEDTGKSEAQEMVDAIVKAAPGKAKEIKNMLKYAANSEEEYDIFDSALDYFESIEDTLESDDTEESIDEPIEDEVEETPEEKPAKSADVDLKAKKFKL